MLALRRVVSFKSQRARLTLTPKVTFSQSSSKDDDHKYVITIDKEATAVGSKRLDKFISEKCGVSWMTAQRYIRSKKVRLQTDSELPPPNAANLHSYILKSDDKIILSKAIYKSLEELSAKQVPVDLLKDPKNVERAAIFEQMVIEETPDFLVINKPSGMSSQGGAKVHLHLYMFVRAYLFSKRRKSTLKGLPRPELESQEQTETNDTTAEELVCRLSQRLDRNTSGVMVIGKTREFSAYYSSLLRDRVDVQKIYLGVVEDIPAQVQSYLKVAKSKLRVRKMPLEFEISDPLTYSGRKQMATITPRFDSNGKPCTTRAKVLGFFKFRKTKSGGLDLDYRMLPNKVTETDGTKLRVLRDNDQFFSDGLLTGSPNAEYDLAVSYQTLMEFEILSGRKHQIRAHAALVLNTPILCDMRYRSYQSKSLDILNWLLAYYSKGSGVGTEDGGLRPDIWSNFERERLEKGDYHYLHSRRLRFSLDSGESSDRTFVASLPLHFRVYLSAFLGDDYTKMTKNL